jgi:hypothetical protein
MFRKSWIRTLNGPVVVTLSNIFFILLPNYLILSMWRLPFNNTNDLRRMGDVIESVAILIICYGVALQERGCLIKLFENPPVLFSHKEE